MTDLVEKVAEALFEHEKKIMGDAWYQPSETFHCFSATLPNPWIESAKAAIDAMQVREMTKAELCGILNTTGWYNEYGVCEMDKEAVVLELAKLGTIRIVGEV